MSSRPPPTPDPKLRNSSLQKYPLTSSSRPQQPCNPIHQHPSNRHIQPLARWPRPAPPPRPSPPLPRRLVLLAPFHPVTTAPSVRAPSARTRAAHAPLAGRPACISKDSNSRCGGEERHKVRSYSSSCSRAQGVRGEG